MHKHILLLAATLAVAACSSSTKVSRPLDQGSDRGEVVEGQSGSSPSSSATSAKGVVAVDYLVGTITVTDEAIPESFQTALKTHLEEELGKAGRLAKSAGSARKVQLTLSDYRMRGGATRILTGVLSGADKVTAAVSVTDKSGQVIGESQVTSSNSLAVGGPDTLAKMAAEEIAKFLIGAPLKK